MALTALIRASLEHGALHGPKCAGVLAACCQAACTVLDALLSARAAAAPATPLVALMPTANLTAALSRQGDWTLDMSSNQRQWLCSQRGSTAVEFSRLSVPHLWHQHCQQQQQQQQDGWLQNERMPDQEYRRTPPRTWHLRQPGMLPLPQPRTCTHGIAGVHCLLMSAAGTARTIPTDAAALAHQHQHWRCLHNQQQQQQQQQWQRLQTQRSPQQQVQQPQQQQQQQQQQLQQLQQLSPQEQRLHQLAPYSTELLGIRGAGMQVVQTVTLRRYKLPGRDTSRSSSSTGSSTGSSSSGKTGSNSNSPTDAVSIGAAGATAEATMGTGAAVPDAQHDAAYLQWAVHVVHALQGAGHSAYFAGGWVRDSLLGRPSQDIDITTSANVLQELPRVFPSYRIRQMPRSTARVEWGGFTLEVTQLKGPRKEADLDSLYYDACLRDFTINSLYYDPVTGDVLDFLDGVGSLRNKVLDLPPYPMPGVSMPSPVIAADPLRVLRAVRFAAGLGLSMTPALRSQLVMHKSKCTWADQQGTSGVGNKRLWRELSKVCSLRGSAVHAAFELMAQLQLLQVLFPEIAVGLAMPAAETCRVLQGLLGEVAAQVTPRVAVGAEGVPPLPVPLAMRLLALVDPGQGRSAQHMLHMANQRMLQVLGEQWAPERVLFSAAGHLLELHMTVMSFKPTQTTAPAGQSQPQHQLSQELQHHLQLHMMLGMWQASMRLQVWPLLDAWIKAWTPPEQHRLWSQACYVVLRSPDQGAVLA